MSAESDPLKRDLTCLFVILATGFATGCGQASAPAAGPARNILIFTIDTLRADRVGAYGYSRARTPAMDALAKTGVVFDRAYAVAPITLPSHASLLTGRYPPGHGARHNGIRVDPSAPTLAEALTRAGFATAAFVGAFPLDRRFGLTRGFGTYGDRMPRGAAGRPANERPGREVADEAIAWLGEHRSSRFFLWVHFFEPHAPYGDATDGRPVDARYDDEVAEADRQVQRVVDALGDARASTAIVVTADHGEAFGEHGEIAHSIFIYDTTLRVPLILVAPAVTPGRSDAAVSHVDLAPTLMRILALPPLDADGIDLGPAIEGKPLPQRDLYAESFAPLLDFGWSPLRAVRMEGWKFIDAPRPELYATGEDPAENSDRSHTETARVASLRERLKRYPTTAPPRTVDGDARARLQALGYASGDAAPSASRPDPKDRRALAAQIARVTSGELRAGDLEATLREILRLDPRNPLAHLRLGYVLQESSRCAEAVPHFKQAIDAKQPGADAHLGLAACQTASRQFDAAAATLREADRVEPDNPVVAANLGLALSNGRVADGVPHLQRALALDPDFNEARFHLAVALARLGRREAAAREAEELLRRLPPDAPQRPEVLRLLAALKR